MRKHQDYDSSEEEDDEENNFPNVHFQKSAVFAPKPVETKPLIVED